MKKTNKKLVKALRIANVVMSIVVTGMSIYRLIPKEETFEGVDADKLVNSMSAKNKNA